MCKPKFRNIKPKSRGERRALKDSAALERERLKQRSGSAAKSYRENAPETPWGLLVPERDAAGFLSDADRFHSDTCGEEYVARRQKYEREQAVIGAKRVERLEREEKRWDSISATKAAEEAYWQEQRTLGQKARKNHSSVPYDTVNLMYADNLDGDRLRFQDDKVRYRAIKRADNLRRCGDTRTGYNIINGDQHRPLPGTHLPQPQPSEALASHIDRTLAKESAERASFSSSTKARRHSSSSSLLHQNAVSSLSDRPF